MLSLKQMRTEIGGEFFIIASCWPGDRDNVAQILNLTDSHVRQLDLLTRDEIVQVIRSAGVGGPNALVREIVNQAEGRPGLAVTLTQACLQGGVREVALGDVLSRSIRHFIEPLVGHEGTVVLAAISIGGDAGMTLQAVGSALALRLISIHNIVTRLAAGGVITELNEQRLSVRPITLRYALIRDIFFRGASSYPIEPILEITPDLQQTSLTLIGAKARGAAVPDSLLTTLAEQVGSNEVWAAYAGLGREEALRVIQRRSQIAVAIADPILFHVPESALPLLLTAAIGDQRQLHSTPEHPLRRISDWINEARPGTEDVVDRRRILLEAVERWLGTNGDVNVGLRALQSVLNPGFEYHTTDPGAGNRGTFSYGYIPNTDMIAIQNFWPRVVSLITRSNSPNWRSIHEIAEAWAYPGRISTHVSDETLRLMQSFAAQMLQDIISIARDRPGVLHWIRQIVDHLQLNISIPLSAEFEILYPQRSHSEDWHVAEQREVMAVHQLAQLWSTLDPTDVAPRLAQLETEAQEEDIRWPRWTQLLCTEIASRIVEPSRWARAMIQANCMADLVGPFLRRASDIGESDWVELARECLSHANFKYAAVSLILTSPDPQQDLLEQVLSDLEGYATYVELACAQNLISEHLVVRLLRHADPAIAVAAAAGEWSAAPHGIVRASLRDDWQQVVISHARGVYWLDEAFQDNSDLAFRWLQARLAEDFRFRFGLGFEQAVRAAVNVLDVEARRSLLRQIPDRYGFSELIRALINEHLDLYRELLRNMQLRQYHLAPLTGHPEGTWLDKALAALESGYSPDDVARAVHGYPREMAWTTGNESAMWTEWLERFDRLCSHEDDRIRQIGEAGKTRITVEYENALRRERHEAIYGSR